MVAVKLRGVISQADLDELEQVYRQLQKMMIGMNPSAPIHAPLYAAMATVRACGVDWSQNPHIWISARGPVTNMPGHSGEAPSAAQR